MEERVAKAKAKTKVLVSVNSKKHKKEDQFLSGDVNSKNKEAPLLRKDPSLTKMRTKLRIRNLVINQD